MAYMNQEMKAKVQAAVTPILAKYGVKGTLSVQHNMSLTLTITKGKLDFITDMVEKQYSVLGERVPDKDEVRKRYCLEINEYWFHEHYTGESLNFLNEIIPAMKAADWYDKSDITTDYFHTAYYFYVKVGRWDKPYVVAA